MWLPTGLHFRQPEIKILGVATLGSFCVRGVERVGNFDGEREDQVCFQWTASDLMLQRLPVQKFHDDKWLTVLLPDLVNSANVRIVQGRSGLPLFETGRVTEDRLLPRWAGISSAQGYVFCLIDHTHPAAA
jgi:hypothetical protein